MPDYPSSIFSPRYTENLPGLSRATETGNSLDQNLFSEDYQDLGGEINAIEMTLGFNPEGTFPDVVSRLDDYDSILAYGLMPLGTNIAGAYAGGFLFADSSGNFQSHEFFGTSDDMERIFLTNTIYNFLNFEATSGVFQLGDIDTVFAGAYIDFDFEFNHLEIFTWNAPANSHVSFFNGQATDSSSFNIGQNDNGGDAVFSYVGQNAGGNSTYSIELDGAAGLAQFYVNLQNAGDVSYFQVELSGWANDSHVQFYATQYELFLDESYFKINALGDALFLSPFAGLYSFGDISSSYGGNYVYLDDYAGRFFFVGGTKINFTPPEFATRTLALAGSLQAGDIYSLPISGDNKVLCVV